MTMVEKKALEVASPTIAMVVAYAHDQVIGKDGAMPWHLPADLKHFKTVTMGKPIIMGRRTYQSIGRALPGRLNIVLTTNEGFAAEDGVQIVNDIEKAIALAEGEGASEICVIGGAEVYRQLAPRTGRLYVTEIDMKVEGDTWFPAFSESEWIERSRTKVAATPTTPALVFRKLERREGSATGSAG
ncbi:MAG: dihydrofolate reductase [Pseudomonadota bacterium]